MNKDKQIEEMAKVIHNTGSYNTLYERDSNWLAQDLYNSGYRKASEVAREIFEEIERSFIEYYDKTITYSSPTLPYHTREAVGFSLNVLFMEIEKLKKMHGG